MAIGSLFYGFGLKITTWADKPGLASDQEQKCKGEKPSLSLMLSGGGIVTLYMYS
jgi:hypothetical protein